MAGNFTSPVMVCRSRYLWPLLLRVRVGTSVGLRHFIAFFWPLVIHASWLATGHGSGHYGSYRFSALYGSRHFR